MNNEFTDQLKNLKVIFWGSFWSSFGIFGGYAIEYLIKIVIARNIGLANYGLIILLFTTTGFVSSVSTLGLNVGASRHIAYYLGRNEHYKAVSVVSTGFRILLLSAFGFTVLAFFFRDAFVDIFIKREVDPFLVNCFLGMIPILVLAEYAHACLRGYKHYKIAIVSKELLRRAATFLVILVVFAFSKSIHYLAIAYFVGICVFFFAATAALLQSNHFKWDNRVSLSKLNRSFLLFSLPLFFSFLIKQFSGQIAIFFIGFYHTTIEIGLYSCALSFSQLVSLPLTTVLFMFVPVVSGLWSENKTADIQFVFDILIKWLWLSASLIYLVVLTSPHLTIGLSFGPSFIRSVGALEILAIAHLFYCLMGLNGALLISFGNSKIYFIADFLSILFVMFLFPYLTQRFGYVGAAFCILIRLIVLNVAWFYILKFKYQIQSKILRYLLCSLSIIVVVHLNRYLWGDSQSFSHADIIKLSSNLLFLAILVRFLKLSFKRDLSTMLRYLSGRSFHGKQDERTDNQ